jgi:TBC domain-containing protein kinase-like protein
MDDIGFIPDLYAISWFLTMYAHVFPLHKIFHLWDMLLLGNSSFPLCIGVAILQQLRDQLLKFGFNECILLFSDMPEIDIDKCVQDSIRIFCSTPKSATYRQHAHSPKATTRSKPVHSYYTQDYHETPKTDLSMDPIPFDELKSEKFPRISAEDLIELCELSGLSHGSIPGKLSKSTKLVVVVIDVRSEDEYKRGAMPRSLNIPFHTAFGADGELLPCPAVSALNQRWNQVKVVVGGSRGRHTSHFAESLIRLGYPKVCVLHKGIDVLRATGLLTITSPDL